MNISRLFNQLAIALGLSSTVMLSYANEVEVSNNAVNYVLWFAVVAGVVAGLGFYHYLHKNFKTHEKLKSWAVAVGVAVIIASLPLWLGDFANICMQSITDSSGQVRDMVTAADQCVLSREEVSAWGISSVIAGFKSALGYSDAGSFLSTGLVRFFYCMVVIFWTSISYLVVLWLWKKFKH